MSVQILVGDVRAMLATLPDASVHTVVTSPPYWGLRDYGVAGQIGLEATPAEYVDTMVQVFREVRRVLRADGTCWINLGDSYSGYHGNKNATYDAAPSNKDGYFENQRTTTVGVGGLKAKDLVGIPWTVALALRSDGWYLRQDIVWSKPNPMPESVRDRCTKSHEYIFLLSKSERYHFDADAIAEPFADASLERLRQDVANQKGSDRVPGKTNGNMKAVARHLPVEAGRNKRSVWTVTTQPFKEAHFATFPPALIEPCILAGAPAGGTVLDPFGGAGTTGLVADRHGRNAILIELNPEYAAIAKRRIEGDSPLFAEVA